MNQKELERTRRENLNKLDTAFRPKINAVEIDINNSIEHELAKFICVWLIRDGIPANELQEAYHTFLLHRMSLKESKLGQKFKHEWERPQIITEARFKETKVTVYPARLYNIDGMPIGKTKARLIEKRRADIFILDTGEIVEIETDKKVKKEGDNVITVRI